LTLASSVAEVAAGRCVLVAVADWAARCADKTRSSLQRWREILLALRH
jgi:hypothetical protein